MRDRCRRRTLHVRVAPVRMIARHNARSLMVDELRIYSIAVRYLSCVAQVDHLIEHRGRLASSHNLLRLGDPRDSLVPGFGCGHDGTTRRLAEIGRASALLVG